MIATLKSRHLSAMGIVPAIFVAILAQTSAVAADATPANAGAREQVTFSKDVAPILRELSAGLRNQRQ